MTLSRFRSTVFRVFLAGGLSLLLAAGARATPLPSGSAPVAEVVNHRYLLDPSGMLDTAVLAASPERWRALPAWWHRDPPGVIRWERLDLRWQGANRTDGGIEGNPVLHLRTVVGNDIAVSYAPTDPHCGRVPTQILTEHSGLMNLARWVTVPLCVGAEAVYLRFTTTRDVGPLNQVRSRAEVSRLDFSSTANAYLVGLFTLLSLVFGAIGTGRTRDLFWVALLFRTLLVSPYFAQHGAAPPDTPSEPIIRGLSTVPPDWLLAALTLGHNGFLLGLLWPKAKTGWPRKALLALCATALAGVVLAVAAPYPFGVQLSLATTLLAGPIALLVLGSGSAAPDAALPAALHRQQTLTTAVVVVLGSISTVLVFHPGYWRPLQFTVGLFHLSLAAWVALRATARRNLAVKALFAEQISRQRAEDRAREQEERRLETRDLMLMLTHEIRTPLAVLQLSVEAAATSAQAHRRVHEAIAEMDRLIERCMETARLDTETAADAAGHWSAEVALEEIRARSRAPERVQLAIGEGTDLPLTHPVVINAIVAILVDNALRYGATAPVDLCTVQAGSTEIKIDVSNVIGPLGAPDPARLFQKYYRGPGAHRQSGAGLGLYLASRLADRLGGRLIHESTVERTRFTLWIPR